MVVDGIIGSAAADDDDDDDGDNDDDSWLGLLRTTSSRFWPSCLPLGDSITDDGDGGSVIVVVVCEGKIS